MDLIKKLSKLSIWNSLGLFITAICIFILTFELTFRIIALKYILQLGSALVFISSGYWIYRKIFKKNG